MGKVLRILNIDDSESDSELVNGHLADAGYDVVGKRVDTAAKMSAELSSKQWDIVLCDYSMPKFSAIAALETLHASGLDIPFIIISGTIGEETAVEAMLSGANDYLTKDNLKRLVPSIERELAEAENRRVKNQAETERKVIFEIIQGVTSTPNLYDFFTLVYRSLRQVVKAENCFIMLKDPESDMVHFEFWADKFDPRPEPRPMDNGFASYVLRTRKPLLITPKIKKWLQDEGEAEVVGTVSPSWIGVPLRTPIRTIGVLALQDYENENAYTERDLDFLSTIGDQVALAIDRKKSEEALRESESRYRMLFDYSPDGIVIVDRNGYFLEANSSMYRMLDYSNEELIGLNVREVLSITDIRRADLALEELKAKAEDQSEWLLRRKDGSVFAAEVTANRMPDDSMIATVRDIAERKDAEAEKAALNAQIENQRQRLNKIVANVPGIVWETTGAPDTGYGTGDFVGEYITTMLGYTAEDWHSTPNFWLTIVHPDHQEKIFREAAEAFLKGESLVQEFPWIAKDGRVVWVEAHSAVIFSPEGNPIGLRGVTIDITDRKRAAEALRSSEERYRDLVENAIDMIYAHDLLGNYTSVNRSAERITGYTRDEILQMNLTQTVAPEFIEKAKEMMAAKLSGRGDTAYELEVVVKDGSRIAVEVNTRLIYENGEPVSVQGIARDITERKHLEEKFRQSQKMEAIGLLAGGIAHDFNNLLTAISGYSELTLGRMEDDDPLRHNIVEIKDAGARAAALTSQLLAFSRKQVLKPLVHNLNSVITDIEKMLRRIIRESIEFRVDLAPDLHNIKADPGQIEQVIMNLSVNARDAMPKGGTLTIKTENVAVDNTSLEDGINLDTGQFVKMTVTDTGEGMDEETQKRMFEPFFTTKDAGKGTGLGLSTVYGIVKQSGGDIRVQSNFGHGTTFEIYLPSVDDPAQSVKWNGNGHPKTAGNETVLLVEDEAIVRNLVREILISNGYNVLEAASGKEALSICETRKQPIHLLLTDLVMPKMSGFELMEHVLKLMPQIKVLLMSGYTDDSIIPAASHEISSGFIEKPFTPEGLAQKIRETLGHYLA